MSQHAKQQQTVELHQVKILDSLLNADSLNIRVCCLYHILNLLGRSLNVLIHKAIFLAADKVRSTNKLQKKFSMLHPLCNSLRNENNSQANCTKERLP